MWNVVEKNRVQSRTIFLNNYINGWWVGLDRAIPNWGYLWLNHCTRAGLDKTLAKSLAEKLYRSRSCAM